MTIRFVKYWNGYSPDAIVHNLGSTEEARLVSLGYATTDLDGPGSPEGELARLSTTPSGDTVIPLPNGDQFSLGDKKFKSGVLMCLQSSGTVGDNGALSGLTAFPVALGPCFLFFIANALYAGSVAGFYYANVTSTTTATVYNDRWTGGVPEYPATPTPIVATGPGAYTQTTGVDVTAASFIIPGGSLGPNGSLTLFPQFGANNTAGSKAWTAKLANKTLLGKANTTATMDNTPMIMRNAGAVDKQIATQYVGFSSSSGALFTRTTVDTTVDQEFIITLKLAVATDYFFLQGYDANLSF